MVPFQTNWRDMPQRKKKKTREHANVFELMAEGKSKILRERKQTKTERWHFYRDKILRIRSKKWKTRLAKNYKTRVSFRCEAMSHRQKTYQ